MARISTYAVDGTPTVNDKVIGTDAENADVTMNYTIGDIIGLVPGGSSSVQSLNSLTGALNLVGAGGNTITVSGTTITITGTPSGGGTVTSLTTSGTQGAATLISGVLNIPEYDTSSGITSINSTASGPNVNIQGQGGIVVTEAGNTITISDSGTSEDVKFKIDEKDTQAGYWADKVFPGGGITKTTLTDADGVKTVQLNQSLPSIVNSIKVGGSITQGTYEFTGSGVTMTSGGAGQPSNIINFAGGGTSLPYTTYVARYSTSGATVLVQQLENTTGGTFSWTRNTGLTTDVEIRYSGVLGSQVLILCNGRGGDKSGGAQAFYNTTDNVNVISISVFDQAFAPSPIDIVEGMFELRIYDK